MLWRRMPIGEVASCEFRVACWSLYSQHATRNSNFHDAFGVDGCVVAFSSLIGSSFWILSKLLYGPITITSPALTPEVIIVRWRSLAPTVTGVTMAFPSFMR